MNTFHDVALIAKTLAENRVFEFTAGRGQGIEEMPDLIQRGTEAVASGRVLKKYKDTVMARSVWKAEGDGAGGESPRPKARDEAEEEDEEEETDCDDADALELEGDMPGVNEEDEET